ncbi:hypothetical protein BCU70_08710 [Vibrio sp. 10N.286.49.C2]|uniref:hypothetical protein n=1 Tax=unclassified Vibrio TaxID=2614977 RepID=UPI000C819A4B|nr:MULTISPECIES: hypothetical protein [unclassified Vibrio]PMH27524.1 hypothetical protein BCU70_08710 [Vibrio sp. 10N.286.49.C2]PMH52949.1 hypothetical protein BCU66_14830 [Vibrio sp. 10N.286.49.B1]
MTNEQTILYNALARTDAYIVAADQKASFVLAAGVTFMGIYASLFYSILSDEEILIPSMLIGSFIGIPLVIWTKWFFHIKSVFTPRLASTAQTSLVSFASMSDTHQSINELKSTYDTLMSGQFDLDNDLLENYWICTSICMDKMSAFTKSLRWLFFALGFSIFSLASLAAYVTYLG